MSSGSQNERLRNVNVAGKCWAIAMIETTVAHACLEIGWFQHFSILLVEYLTGPPVSILHECGLHLAASDLEPTSSKIQKATLPQKLCPTSKSYPMKKGTNYPATMCQATSTLSSLENDFGISPGGSTWGWLYSHAENGEIIFSFPASSDSLAIDHWSPRLFQNSTGPRASEVQEAMRGMSGTLKTHEPTWCSIAACC